MPVKSREGKLMAVRVAVHRSWFVAFGVGVLFVALAFLHPLRAHAATITVTGNGDTIAIDGLATLREAITSINNQADVNGDVTLNRVGNYATMVGGTPDVINFNILGAGVKTISVGSALPTLTKPMTINGYSQPGASANSSQNGDNAVILIELDGTNAGGTANGLMVGAGAGGTVIEGLAINRFNGVGILVSGVSATITGNFIGTDAFGSVPFPNMNGVLLQVGATNSTVGGATAPARNLISGNSGSGVGIQGNATKGNVIEGNYIGTKADGITALGNKFGVNISGANGNTIGGTTAGAGNLISGNTNEGVLIQSSGTTGNLIEGNLIGTAYSQTLAASGGSGTGYTFTVTSVTLPAGLILSTSGTSGGTTTSAGMSTFTVQVQDSLGNTATQSYTLTITAAPLTSIALTGPGGATTLTLKVGQSASLTATGTYADHSMQTIPPWGGAVAIEQFGSGHGGRERESDRGKRGRSGDDHRDIQRRDGANHRHGLRADTNRDYGTTRAAEPAGRRGEWVGSGASSRTTIGGIAIACRRATEWERVIK